MALLHWRPHMSLGIEAIDADHRQLIDLLNRLHFMALAGDEPASVGAVLDELVAYARTHFAREEALMQRSGYPHLLDHREQHRQLADRLRTFCAIYEQDPDRFDMTAFYDFVADWLVVHFLEEDMKLKPWVHEASASLVNAR